MASNTGNTKGFVGVWYPEEDSTHANAVELLKSSKTDYVMIKHDKDTDDDGNLKKAHWHIYIRFPNQKSLTAAAKTLGIKYNYLEPCRDEKKALAYFVHLGYPDKYQYDWTEAQGTLVSRLGRICGDDCEEDRVKRILEIIDSFPDTVTYRELLDEVLKQRLYSDFRRMSFILTKLLEERRVDLPRGW